MDLRELGLSYLSTAAGLTLAIQARERLLEENPARGELAEEIRSMTSFYGRCPWIPEPEEEGTGETDKAEE